LSQLSQLAIGFATQFLYIVAAKKVAAKKVAAKKVAAKKAKPLILADFLKA
jgi:hypothetical protein